MKILLPLIVILVLSGWVFSAINSNNAKSEKSTESSMARSDDNGKSNKPAESAAAQASDKLDTRTLKLYDVDLRDATCDEFKAALAKNGVKLRTESEHDLHSDLYDVGNVEGATTLRTFCVLGGAHSLAGVEYRFPRSPSTAQPMTRVIDLITSKYGEPSSATGSANVGSYSGVWNIADDLLILAEGDDSRGAVLRYVNKPRSEEMSQEIRAANAQANGKAF